MDASLFTLGGDAPEAALTLNRVALGVFFAISGYLKLFNASRLAVVMLAGPGPWSLDAIIATRLAT